MQYVIALVRYHAHFWFVSAHRNLFPWAAHRHPDGSIVMHCGLRLSYDFGDGRPVPYLCCTCGRVFWPPSELRFAPDKAKRRIIL
jgi:hypothetical protein